VFCKADNKIDTQTRGGGYCWHRQGHEVTKKDTTLNECRFVVLGLVFDSFPSSSLLASNRSFPPRVFRNHSSRTPNQPSPNHMCTSFSKKNGLTIIELLNQPSRLFIAPATRYKTVDDVTTDGADHKRIWIVTGSLLMPQPYPKCIRTHN